MPKQPNQQIERRYLAQEFRVSKDSGSPKINGYAAKFGVRSEDLGGWVEVIALDAFDAALADNPDVRGLFNHDANLILGRTTSGTLKLSVDKVGLAYEISPPDTQVARDLLISMERGDITQSSFGFICMDAAWGYDEVTGMDVRTVKQALLFDVSPVTYPAYTDTTSEARSLPSDMPVEVRSKLTASKPEKRDDSDDDDCDCDCAQCESGACELCSNDDCDDDDCDCQEDRSAHNASENRKLAIRIALRQRGVK
jgi:HK97 family phage prohead protease